MSTCTFIEPSVCAPAASRRTPGISSIGAGNLKIEEAQCALGVQPVDQMLDVGQRILRVHQAGDGVLEFAPVHADGRVHREQVVLAGMVDVQVGVQHVSNVPHAHAVLRQLVLDHVLVELQAAHAERFHDLVRAVAGVDHDRPRTTEDEEAEGRHPARAAAVAPQHQEARFELDVAVVENLDFECHCFPLAVLSVRSGDAVDAHRGVVQQIACVSRGQFRGGVRVRVDQFLVRGPDLLDREIRAEHRALRAEDRDGLARDLARCEPDRCGE